VATGHWFFPGQKWTFGSHYRDVIVAPPTGQPGSNNCEGPADRAECIKTKVSACECEYECECADTPIASQGHSQNWTPQVENPPTGKRQTGKQEMTAMQPCAMQIQ